MVHKAIQRLDEDLQNGSEKERIGLLKKVYEQIVPGSRGRKRKPGFYRDSIQGGSGNVLEFILHFEAELRKYGMKKQADRMRNDFYSGLYIPKD